MVEFKVNIGDKASKKTYKVDLKGDDADKLVGKKIGETFRGELVGLPGYELEIRGGSDKSGFPMRPDVPGQARKRLLLEGGVGYKPPKKHRGKRVRKSVHGNVVSQTIVQLNCSVKKAGSQNIDKLLGAGEKKESAPKEAEAKPEETKSEESKKA